MAAMQTTSSSEDMARRIEELARPKRFASGFERDRRSVYWVEREPPKPGPDGVTVIIATPRVQELAQHRDPDRQWRGDRLTAIWPVSKSAQQASASERLSYLAQPREFPHYLMERSPYMTATPAARSASASHRLEQLAEPKDRTDPFETYQKAWGQYFPVPSPALHARTTERVDQLAEPKKYPKEFQGEKPVQWPVSEQALKSLASLRLQQLSRPRSRTMIRDDYDPYKVSPAARKTRPTPRLEELSAPIPRKIRSKKV
ncbi:sperm microtubule associated protein 2-like [Babylonia areolata]|uniref:sperm microtubule associated protein 2-like n=1 Tax=Babylonia areolata TaxID=304850 RepID=UPI003FD623F4